jgi:hypothetical protein
LLALVVAEPPDAPVFLSELEHAAASNAAATSTIDSRFMLVLMGLLVVLCGGVFQTGRLRTSSACLRVSGRILADRASTVPGIRSSWVTGPDPRR